jgi:hypothetical protein
MNEKEEKQLIEEYLKTKIRRADRDEQPGHVDDAAPLPNIPSDSPSTTAGGDKKRTKV